MNKIKQLLRRIWEKRNPRIFCQYCGRAIKKGDRVLIVDGDILHSGQNCIMSHWQRKIVRREETPVNTAIVGYKTAIDLAKKREVKYRRPY